MSWQARARRVAAWCFWLVRPRLPWPLAERVLAKRVVRLQADPTLSADAVRQMEHLVGALGRASEVDRLAPAYIAFDAGRNENRWHPRRITRQRVVGHDNLAAAHAQGRGVILSFVHHAEFGGLFKSVARGGIPVHVVSAGAAFDAGGPQMIQHFKTVGSGGGLVRSDAGRSAILAELRRGHVVAIAIDVPGRTTVRFAGRAVRCSAGAVVTAREANAPIVVATSHREGDGVVIRLSEPIDPSGFADVQSLVQELADRHQEAVLAWPEATFLPRVCWRPIDESD